MQAAVDRGYNLIGESRQKAAEMDFHEWLARSHQVGGLLFCSNWLRRWTTTSRLTHRQPIFIVILSSQPRSSVLPDSVKGGFTATAHLLSIGRKRLAYVGGTPTWKCTRDRWKASNWHIVMLE